MTLTSYIYFIVCFLALIHGSTCNRFFSFAFMQHAFEAGTIVAIVAGIVGYFVVLRRSSFAAHALSHIGFSGAAAAVLIGVNPVYGLLVFTSVGGLGIAALGQRAAQT